MTVSFGSVYCIKPPNREYGEELIRNFGNNSELQARYSGDEIVALVGKDEVENYHRINEALNIYDDARSFTYSERLGDKDIKENKIKSDARNVNKEAILNAYKQRALQIDLTKITAEHDKVRRRTNTDY